MNARLRMTTAAVAVIAGIAVIPTGCGSDEDSGSASAGDASSAGKAAFIKKANAACTREREQVFERVEAYKQKHKSEKLPERVLSEQAVEAAQVSTIAAEMEALQAIEAPVEDSGEIRSILAGSQAALEEAMKRPRNSSNSVEDYFDNVDLKFQDYGLTSCAKTG